MTAQQLIEKLQQTVTELEANSSALIAQNQIKSSSAVILPNLGDILPIENSSTIAKAYLPYPSNLKVEKQSETLILVSWDPPTAPLSFNQSIEGDNYLSTDSNDQTIAIQTYNIFLNNELYSTISGNEERVTILKDVDLNNVIIFSSFKRIAIFNSLKKKLKKKQTCSKINSMVTPQKCLYPQIIFVNNHIN